MLQDDELSQDHEGSEEALSSLEGSRQALKIEEEFVLDISEGTSFSSEPQLSRFASNRKIEGKATPTVRGSVTARQFAH